MRSLPTLIFALIIVTSSLGNAHATALRSSVTVETEFVRLGDIFTDVGKAADVIVAGAPAPGQKEVYSTQRLWSIAREHKLDWTPSSRYDRVTVERSGRMIDEKEIVDQVRQELIAAGMPKTRKVLLITRNLSLFVPIGSPKAFSVENLRYDSHTGRFAAVITVPVDDRSVNRAQITGKTYELIEVPVLSRRMRRGEIITHDDLRLARLRRDTLDRNALLDADRIVGMAAKRILKAGTPLRGRELQRPIVVAKGSLVTLVIRTRNMVLTAKGRAMQNGAAGDTVRVMNTRSKTTVEGIVDSPNRIIITVASAAQ